MFHRKNRCFYTQIWNLWVLHYNRNSSMFVEYSNKIDIFNGMIAYTVRRFCHCNTLLLPQVRRNIQHRDNTRRGKTSFRSHLMFPIQSCIFSLGMHSSSRSRTRDMTLICGLNHGWNRTFIKLFDSEGVSTEWTAYILRGTIPILGTSWKWGWEFPGVCHHFHGTTSMDQSKFQVGATSNFTGLLKIHV